MSARTISIFRPPDAASQYPLSRFFGRESRRKGRLRNLVGPQDELEIASERLGHASTATTKKFYRSNVTNVTPLMSHKTQEKS